MTHSDSSLPLRVVYASRLHTLLCSPPPFAICCYFTCTIEIALGKVISINSKFLNLKANCSFSYLTSLQYLMFLANSILFKCSLLNHRITFSSYSFHLSNQSFLVSFLDSSSYMYFFFFKFKNKTKRILCLALFSSSCLYS